MPTAEPAVSPADAGPGGGYVSPRPGRGQEFRQHATPAVPGWGSGAMTFKERPDHELDRLPDEELIAYVVAAREAGRPDAARRGLAIFAWRRHPDLVRRAQLKVKSREDAEDLAMQAIEGVLRSAFEGTSPGEAVKLMHRILDRRIADFYRDRERKPPPGDLPEERPDEERKEPDAAVSKDDKDEVWVSDLIEREYEKLSPHHRMVVDLAVFGGHSSEETADLVNQEFPNLDTPMTAQNVDQIKSRFRKVMRGELDDGG